MPTGILMAVIVAGIIVVDAIIKFIIRKSTGGIKMNYQKLLNKVLQGTRIVLENICIVGYIIGSLISFTCTWAADKLGNTESNYTIELDVFGYEICLTTKRRS